MNIFENDFYYYPLIKHPLCSEKKEVKASYYGLIRHFCEIVNSPEVISSLRFRRYKNDYFSEIEAKVHNFEKSAKQILGTRFVPFKFFSYRFIFVFDCIYLIAFDDYEKAKAICYEAKKYINQRYHKRIDELANDLFSGKKIVGQYPCLTEEMLFAWSSLQEYRTSQTKRVLLTATMSAGKSTLVNAIFGTSLAPTKKAACTSTVTGYIPMPTYHPHYLLYGIDETGIDCVSDEAHHILEMQNAQTNVIGFCPSCLSQKKLLICDTPGINSSQHPEHKAITREALTESKVDCIVYVIPVENYGASDDYSHLKFILQHALFRKVVFVVNMVDDCNTEDDDIEEIIVTLKGHLSDIGYKDPIVCPISAKAGFFFKQDLLGKNLSLNARAELLKLQQVFEDPDLDLSRFYPSYSQDDLGIAIYGKSSAEEINTDKREMLTSLLHSGLPQFERLLFDIIQEV